MAYIGKTPITGNFVKLDAISVVNGQAGYTMNNGGSAFTDYENVNQFLVSLNGILQAPTTSFTVSGSTITFASNLSTGDVIDFIIVLGNTLDIGTPSDATVTQAKTNFVSTSSSAGLQIKGDSTTAGTLQLNCEQNSHGIKLQSPPHSANQSYTLKFPSGNVTAGKVLKVDSVSGSGTTGIGTLTFGEAGGDLTPSWNARLSSTQSFAGDTNTKINFDTELWDTDSAYDTSNKRFTVPSGEGGKYMYYITLTHTYASDRKITLKLYKNGSGVHQADRQTNSKGFTLVNFIDLSAGDYIEAYYYLHENPVSGVIQSGTDYSFFGGFKLLGV